jgi:DKNYY family
MHPRYPLPDQKSYVKLPRDVSPEGLQFLGHLFATDGNRVFSTRGVLKDIEAATFKIVKESSEPSFDGSFVSAYAVASDRAIYADELYPPRIFKLPSVSGLSVLAPQYATDGITVFRSGVKILGAEVSSFRPISSDYSLDRRRCFFRSHRIIGANPASFRLVGERDDWNLHLSCDNNSIFYCEMPVVELFNEKPVLQRDSEKYIVGVTVGNRKWSMLDLQMLYREAIKPTTRSIVFSEPCSNIKYSDAMFAGLEKDLAIFLQLCSLKTIGALEEATRGQLGEKEVVRAIERLNHQLPAPVATVSATTITITEKGVTAYQHYGPPIDALATLLSALGSEISGALFKQNP